MGAFKQIAIDRHNDDLDELMTEVEAHACIQNAIDHLTAYIDPGCDDHLTLIYVITQLRNAQEAINYGS